MSPANRRRLNRLRSLWQRHLGVLALPALALLLVAAGLGGIVRPLLADARHELLRQRAALTSRPALPGANPPDLREAWWAALPAQARRGESVAHLLRLLGESGLFADRADYTAEDQEPGLVRMRVTLPVKGSYMQVRKLIGSVLDTLPYAALDGLTLEREAETGEVLTSQLRLSLFYRRSAP